MFYLRDKIVPQIRLQLAIFQPIQNRIQNKNGKPLLINSPHKHVIPAKIGRWKPSSLKMSILFHSKVMREIDPGPHNFDTCCTQRLLKCLLPQVDRIMSKNYEYKPYRIIASSYSVNWHMLLGESYLLL